MDTILFLLTLLLIAVWGSSHIDYVLLATVSIHFVQVQLVITVVTLNRFFERGFPRVAIQGALFFSLISLYLSFWEAIWQILPPMIILLVHEEIRKILREALFGRTGKSEVP
jgi:hypothetical protein